MTVKEHFDWVGNPPPGGHVYYSNEEDYADFLACVLVKEYKTVEADYMIYEWCADANEWVFQRTDKLPVCICVTNLPADDCRELLPIKRDFFETNDFALAKAKLDENLLDFIKTLRLFAAVESVKGDEEGNLRVYCTSYATDKEKADVQSYMERYFQAFRGRKP